MTSSTMTNTGTFERMTKEEKLRFCQDLIRQAATLSKSSGKSGVLSSSNKTDAISTRPISKSSKRSSSISGAHSKKNKTNALSGVQHSKGHKKSGSLKNSPSKERTQTGTVKHSNSKEHLKSGTAHQSSSKSSVKSAASHGLSKPKLTSKIDVPKHSSNTSERSKSKRMPSSTVVKTHSSSSIRSTSKTKSPHKSQSKTSKSGTMKQINSKSSIRSNKSTSKSHSDHGISHASNKDDASGHRSGLKSSPTTPLSTTSTGDSSTKHSKSKTQSHVRSSAKTSKSPEKSELKSRARSGTQKKNGTSSVRSTSKSSAIKEKTGSKTHLNGTSSNKTNKKSVSSVRSTRVREKSSRKQPRKGRVLVKDRTECCAVQFVPKFNPGSSKNQLPVYHLIRTAFGNMVREAICQLDTDKSGVSAQKIIDHIIEHYAFPVDVSEGSIRNRAMFTINAGLRAGTLLSVGSSKSVRIGRMRRNFPRMFR